MDTLDYSPLVPRAYFFTPTIVRRVVRCLGTLVAVLGAGLLGFSVYLAITLSNSWAWLGLGAASGMFAVFFLWCGYQAWFRWSSRTVWQVLSVYLFAVNVPCAIYVWTKAGFAWGAGVYLCGHVLYHYACLFLNKRAFSPQPGATSLPEATARP